MRIENIVNTVILKLEHFDYQLEDGGRMWIVLFPSTKNEWHYLRITEQGGAYRFVLFDQSLPALERTASKAVAFNYDYCSLFYRTPEDTVKAEWVLLLKAGSQWLARVERHWIEANALVQKQYPLRYRKGIVSHAVVRAALQDIYRLDKELGTAKTNRFIQLVESGYFCDPKQGLRKEMTTKDYFQYCKLCYQACAAKGEKISKSSTGRDLYKKYADGHDAGLLDIPENSASAFAKWIDLRQSTGKSSGYPWEIQKGGDTTHIDLIVSKHAGKEGYSVMLQARSVQQLKECILMFLALHTAGLPITIADPEGIRKRLLAQDNIGVVASYNSVHPAQFDFRVEDDVYDVFHFDDFGKQKSQIAPFITWESLPILKPRKA